MHSNLDMIKYMQQDTLMDTDTYLRDPALLDSGYEAAQRSSLSLSLFVYHRLFVVWLQSSCASGS